MLAFHAVVMGGLGKSPSVNLFLIGNELSGGETLLDLSELDKLIGSALSDWNDLLNNVPHDTFGSWGGGKGSLEGPSSVGVDHADEFGKV